MKDLREKTLEAQRDIFRLAEREHDLPRKVISAKSHISYDALGTYSRGEHVMPITEVLRLFDIIPDYLLSRLLAPVGRIFAVEEGSDGDMDELGREAAGFVAEYVDCKSDGKITPIEHTRLKQRADRLGEAVQKATAA